MGDKILVLFTESALRANRISQLHLLTKILNIAMNYRSEGSFKGGQHYIGQYNG